VYETVIFSGIVSCNIVVALVFVSVSTLGLGYRTKLC
jgi:hypothetical protein